VRTAPAPKSHRPGAPVGANRRAAHTGGGTAGPWVWASAAWLPYAVVVVGCLAGRRVTYLQGDLALLDVDALRAGRFQQLLGPYDRFGWHHLGPTYAYLMAAVGWMVGGHHPLQAEALTAAGLNGAALAGGCVVARRVLGPAAAAGVLGVGALLIVSLGTDAVFNPWPPVVVVMPLILLTVLSLAVLSNGGGFLLLGGLLVASFCVQTDVGTAPYVAVLVVVACLGWGWGHRPGGPPGLPGGTPQRLWVALAAAALAAFIVLAWTAVIIQQLTGPKGNLSVVFDFFRSAHAHAGLAAGLRAAGWAQLAAFGDRPPGGPPVGWTGLVAALVVLVLACALMLAGWRLGRPIAARSGAVWLLGSMVAIGAGGEIVGPAYAYLTIWAVAPLGAGAVGLVSLLSGAGPDRWRSSALPLVLAAAVSLSVTGDVLSRRAVPSYSSPVVSRAWALVAPAVADYRAVGVAYANEAQSWNIGTGLVDQLERSHRRVEVLSFWSNQVTSDATGPVTVWVNVLAPGAPLSGHERYLGTVGGRRLVVAGAALVPADASY